MCYASQQVKRKVFDYNAYIQGRLKGEYVVIYHSVDEVPEEIPIDVETDIKAVPIYDVQDTTIVSIISFSNNMAFDIIWATTISCDVFTDYYYNDTTNGIALTKATLIYCRGAPQ